MKIVLAYDRLDDIRQLFCEYTAMLVETDETVKSCLAAQGYGDELDHVEEKYGLCRDDGRSQAVRPFIVSTKGAVS